MTDEKEIEQSPEEMPAKKDQVILNMEAITRRAQQISALFAIVCIIVGFSSWFWGFIFTAPMNAKAEHDKMQDQKIELIIENQKKQEAKQDQQYFEIRKDQAVYGEKVNQVYEALTAIRVYMKEDYKRGKSN